MAFYTLLERKVLGYAQFRKGPNKVSFLGILQPISDAIKLLTKEINKISYWKLFYYLVAPILLLVIMIIGNSWIEREFICIEEPKIMGLLCTLALGSYGILFIGWGSNSTYPVLGVYRVLALIISYEVCIIIVFLFLFFLFLDRMNFFLI